MAGGFGVEDADPTAGPAIEGLQKELAGYDRGIALTAGSMFGAGLEAIESKDAAKFVAGRLGLLKAVTKGGSFNKVPLKEKPEIKEGAETVGGFTLHRARLRYDIDRAVADLPEEGREAARTSLKRSLGGDESSIWIGTDGKVVLQLTGKDWSEAKALAAAYIDNTQELAKSEAYQFTRKQLPADATLLIILDAAQTAHSVFGMLRDTGTAPKKVPEPKAVGAKTAYVGIALVLKPGHGRFELFVPAAAVDSIRKLVEPLLDNDK